MQCIGRDQQQLKIVLEGEDLKQVEDFVYLGELSLLTSPVTKSEEQVLQ